MIFLSIAGFMLVAVSGLPFALLIRRRRPHNALLGDAILFSLALGVLPYACNAFIDVPLRPYAFFLIGCAIYGVGWISLLAMRRRSELKSLLRRTSIYEVAALLIIGVFAVNLLFRVTFEWDAVTYYLNAAVGWTLQGHVTSTFPKSILVARNIPLSLPPLMPVTYADVMSISRPSYEAFLASTRLVPLALILLLWVSTRRLAQNFVSNSAADFAALLAVIAPATVYNVFYQPFYLDLPVAACVVAAFAAFYDFSSERNVAGAFVLGIAVAMTCLAKVTGFPFILTAAITFAVFLAPRVFGRVAAVLFIFACIVSALVLPIGHPFLQGFAQWGVLLICAGVAVAIVPKARKIVVSNVTLPESAALLIPIAAAIGLTLWQGHNSGSLFGFYTGTAEVHERNWSWAWRLISKAGLYDNYGDEPGIPEHLGIGLLLSWLAFAPMMAFAIFGAIKARKDENAGLLALSMFCVLCIIEWFTVFHSRDYRHLLPLLPLEVVLATYAMRDSLAQRTASALVLLASVIPLTLLAFANGIFVVPPFLTWTFHYSDYYSLGTEPLICVAVYTAVVIALVIATRRVAISKSVVAMVTALCALFALAPAIMPIFSGGIDRSYRSFADTYVDGFLPALRLAQHAQLTGSVLTYAGLGVPWFTGGALRRIDLMDSVDLALMRDAIEKSDPSDFFHRLSAWGVRTAVLPNRNSYLYSGYQSFVQANGMSAINALSDPLVTDARDVGPWTVYRIRDARRETIRPVLTSGNDVISLSTTFHDSALAGRSRTTASIGVSGAQCDRYEWDYSTTGTVGTKRTMKQTNVPRLELSVVSQTHANVAINSIRCFKGPALVAESVFPGGFRFARLGKAVQFPAFEPVSVPSGRRSAISAIILANEGHVKQGLYLYPRLGIGGDLSQGDLELAVAVVPPPECEKAPLVLSVRGSTDPSSDPAHFNAANWTKGLSVRTGGLYTFALRFRTADASVSSVSLTGVGSCGFHETIAFPSLSFYHVRSAKLALASGTVPGILTELQDGL